MSLEMRSQLFWFRVARLKSTEAWSVAMAKHRWMAGSWSGLAPAHTRHHRRFDAIAHMQLLHQVRHVMFDRAFAERKITGDLFVAEALGQQFQILRFPNGEAVDLSPSGTPPV